MQMIEKSGDDCADYSRFDIFDMGGLVVISGMMPQGSNSQTALITGASSGIGSEFARIFAQNGHDLVLVSRDRGRLTGLANRLVEQFGVRVCVIAQDLSIPNSAADLVNEIQSQSITIDILVNNAGFALQGPVAESSPALMVELLQVNIVTLTQLTRLLLPAMLKRGSGRIMNTASIGAYIPGPLMAAYFASKAYVLSFSQALAEEVRGSGVTVTTLCPGPTRTGFADRAGVSATRAFRKGVMDPADVARIGYRALINGKPMCVPGLLNQLRMLPIRLMPRSFLARCARHYHDLPPASSNPSRLGDETV